MNHQQTPPKKLTDKWVWRSNTASIAAGQFSVLAVFETITVLILYSFLAYYFDYQWWLYLSALAAPLILLRSNASIETGVKQLQNYNNNSISNSMTESDKIIGMVFIALVSLIISYMFSYFWLIYYQGWELFWRAAVVGIFAFVFSMISSAGFVYAVIEDTFSAMDVGAIVHEETSEDNFEVLTFSTFLILFIISFVSVGVGKPAYIGVYIGVLIFTIMIAIKSNHQMIKMVVSPFLMLLLIGVGFGIWLRSLFIRITSTLHYPIKGLRQLPTNLVQILWVIDLSYPPELLPKSKQVNDSFSCDGIISKSKGSMLVVRIGTVFVTILWYIPALLWRWSLKATLWLWWPIAFILRSPFTGKTVANMRDITAWRVHGLSQWLIVLAVAVMVWLLLSLFPQLKSVLTLLPEQIQNFHSQLNINFAPLPLGLRYIALWLCCLLTVVVWVMSRHLAIVHKSLLEDETCLDTLNAERKATFIQRAKHLEIVHTWRIVAFILLGYSMVLYLAYQYYPTELMRFIPASFPAYL